MTIQTNLEGRLKNTSLEAKLGLLALYEAVVNSIHSIEEMDKNIEEGQITIEILRSGQASLDLPASQKRIEPIIGFRVTDNGIGFNDSNFKSFETLDTDRKNKKGCRGIGRLLWLKVFKNVNIDSTFKDNENGLINRKFNFSSQTGVLNLEETQSNDLQSLTIVDLKNINKDYKNNIASKSLDDIAKDLLKHCLWYFVRDKGAPLITVIDEDKRISINEFYKDRVLNSTLSEEVLVENQSFLITHIKFRNRLEKNHTLSFCASDRLVKEENLKGKCPGLYGTLTDTEGEFVYSCYVSSNFLTENVRPERTGFNIEEVENEEENLLLPTEPKLDFTKIREAIYPKINTYLEDSLQANIQAATLRIEKFVAEKAPRYRPILHRIPKLNLELPPNISDKDLDILLHKHYCDIEINLLEKGHEILSLLKTESENEYRSRLNHYMKDVSDLKKSDLANYLFHRKIIIELFENALKQKENGKYPTEDIIHQLIMPLGKNSNDIFSKDTNLWLIDEDLAFHNYLASDIPLNKMPITDSSEGLRPDLLALNLYDTPLLFSENKTPLTESIVIVEIKRPMRDDFKSGQDKDPLDQVLNYLNKIREGGIKLPGGRPLPDSSKTPGFCYILCDLTESIKARCRFLDLRATKNGMGYFGFHKEYEAYIEVISFDKLILNAKKRNQAFFDKLALPTT